MQWPVSSCTLYNLLTFIKVFFFPPLFSALESVDADKVYVLGGLVDESIQKVFFCKTDPNTDIAQSRTVSIISSRFIFSSAEVEPVQSRRAERLHSEAAYRRVHGEKRQREEFPLKDPGC